MVLKEQIYTKFFYSKDLNKKKYDLLLNKANKILKFKQDLSLIITSDIKKYLYMSKFDYLKVFNNQIQGLSGKDIQCAIVDVYTYYSKKYKQLIDRIYFKIQKEIKIDYYIIKTKNNKVGDLKNFEVVMKKTDLSNCLTYLCKYNATIKDLYNSLEYEEDKIIQDQYFYNQEIQRVNLIYNPDELKKETLLLNKVKENIQKQQKYIDFLKKCLYFINKFGFDRIYNLANSRYNRIILNNKPIEFVSKTFNSISVIKNPIIYHNKNGDSIIDCFINLGGFNNQNTKNGSISIPVNYNLGYHGDIKDYSKDTGKQNATSYEVCFEKNKIRINLTKKMDRFIPEFNEITEENVLGVDVNIKHNLFSSSDKEGDIIDYDRNILYDYVKFLKKIDNSKEYKAKLGLSKEEVSRLSNKNQITMDKWIIRVTDMLKRKCNQLVKYCVYNNLEHIVMEDLSNFAKSFVKNDEFDGFKYTRLISMLHFTTIKDIVKSIVYKHNLTVTFIDPRYTSQTCHRCGYCDKNNRKNQETFHCKECHLDCNADYNASQNIKNRLFIDVLRTGLLTKNDFGEFIQKKISKFKLKEFIELYSCINSNVVEEPGISEFIH